MTGVVASCADVLWAPVSRVFPHEGVSEGEWDGWDTCRGGGTRDESKEIEIGKEVGNTVER